MRDRDLVRLYWPVELRSAFDALLAIDDALADVVVRTREPALAAIKLAWWRECLEELDRGAVPAEPRLQGVAKQLLPRKIRGAQIAKLHDGWATLLEETPDRTMVSERGMIFFGLGQRILHSSEPHDADLGRVWAHADIARRLDDASWLDPIGLPSVIEKITVERRARPLTCLSALAWRDHRRPAFEPEGTPGRAWTLLRHRLTGRV